MIIKPFVPGKHEKIIYKQGDQDRVIRSRGADLYLGEITDIEDSILHGTSPRVSLIDSRNNTAAILALLESARTGRPIHPATL